MAYSRDGKRLITGSLDKTARVWDASTGDLLLTLGGHRLEVTSVALSGNRAVTGEADGTVRVWDLATGALVTAIKAGQNVGDIALSPDAKHLAVSCVEGGVVTFDLASGAKTLLHKGCTSRVSFSPNGLWLGIVSPDGAARALRLRSQQTIVLEKIDALGFNSIQFSEDGRKAVTASNWVAVWDLERGKIIARIAEDAFRYSDAEFSRDGRLILSVTARRAEIWPIFTDTHQLVAEAIAKLPRCLTPEQRRRAFLDETGSDDVCPIVHRLPKNVDGMSRDVGTVSK